MASRRLVVVGGVAAGLSAAARARRLDPELEVVVFERSGFCAYTACGLPYHVAGVIPEHEELVMRTPAEFAAEGVDVRVRHEVTAIDADARRVTVVDLESGVGSGVDYDELLLAAGAAPVVPFEGAGVPGCFVVRTVEDSLAIRAWIAAERPRRAIVIGGGYIGLEMAEALHLRGLAVTLLERDPQVLPFVDPEMAAPIVDELGAKGVEVRTGTRVETVLGEERVRGVLADGVELPAELVIVGVGVRPETGLATAAGVAVGPHGGVMTDAAMRTSVAGIWAAGDCCETRHLLHEAPAYIPLGTTANKQGRVAGTNLGGREDRFAGVLGTGVLKVCDLQVGRTGLSEREASAAGLDAVGVTVTHKSRAVYYPGWQPLTVKIVAERRSGRLLGAQLSGREGVAKRVDVFAAALHKEATVDEVAEFDLSYAPPFAPVWDPVLMAARKAVGAV